MNPLAVRSIPAVVREGQCHSPGSFPDDKGLLGPWPAFAELFALTVKSFWLNEGGLGTLGGN